MAVVSPISRKMYFYPRSPCGERLLGPQRCAAFPDFYPRSPCGERPRRSNFCSLRFPFLSTLSLRRATTTRCGAFATWTFLSTLSLRRATPCRPRRKRPQGISIHALLAESDALLPAGRLSWRISIHALLAESDPAAGVSIRGLCNFYPRSPCGERRTAGEPARPVQHFYPRSPCGERRCFFCVKLLLQLFLSTLSLRRATVNEDRYGQQF